METISNRQTEILATARKTGHVHVERLAVHFQVTPQTIRRDLNELCDRGFLHRTHGGALYPTTISNVAYESRRSMAAAAKRRIGQHAAMLIPDNSAVMLNIGTTTEQVAHAMLQHDGILVITNNLNVANILRNAPSAEVIIAGGTVRASDGGVIGEATVDFVRQFRVDFAVVGASAIEADGSILDFDYREVRVAQEIIANARRTILVADAMKFERKAPICIGHIREIDVLVTDMPPPAAFAATCQQHAVRVEVAESPREPVA